MAITQDEMKKLSPSELCSHLIDTLGDSVSGSVLDFLTEQRVSGGSFLELRDEDLHRSRFTPGRPSDTQELHRFF